MDSLNGEEPTSFSDIDWKQQERQDAINLNALLDASQDQGSDNYLFDPDRPLDEGEKAYDAEDFEDISDSELPEETEATLPNDTEAPGLTDDNGTSHDTDDLFGEGRGSSPFGDELGDLFEPQDPVAEAENLRELNFPEYHGSLNQDPNIPAPAESQLEMVKQSYPTFKKNIILYHSQLLPPKFAYFPFKTPLRQPKPVAPTKVSLDLLPDQEKAFRAPGTAQTDKHKRILDAEARGLVPIVEDSSDEVSDGGDFDWSPVHPDEKIGGVTFADLELLLDDWDSKINAVPPEPDTTDLVEEPLDDWEREILGPSAKRRKVVQQETDYINVPRFAVPSFDNFEQDTARIAKGVVLDLNDPHLLVDIEEFNPKTRQSERGTKRGRESDFASILKARFNYSNDQAYDALKENHQHKVRAILGNFVVEHSLPAIKLQWPYYKVKLTTKESRSWHRPATHFNTFLNHRIDFSKLGMRKKKSIKGRPIHEVFKESKDLTLADHYATATLLEYSEEHPMILSNFGMGNRIINYYRRKNTDDPERPMPADRVGDVTVLLPEDTSPFANFGMVDPGETVRTIHNEMFRAPIFKHETKGTDFLIVRNTTGLGGTSWHLRNIDNLFVVGQQFPSMEIPGPHSRKFTNAAKNRLRMIAYRKIRHSKNQTLRIGEVTAHITDSTDMQNRQKLKEFISYDKNEKVWRMKPGEQPPEEATIRAMVKPEEVCTIDALQVGSQQAVDAGYEVRNEESDDEIVDDDGNGQSHKQLTPWYTSKAFLEASAGKAMLQLHGAGDPTGCGLGYSFIKISMKGGYIGAVQGPNATSEAAMEAERKANGGHTYNVRKQEAAYNDAIRNIWDKQKENLSNIDERAENDLELEQEAEDERVRAKAEQTAHSVATPAAFDESASQFSTGSHSTSGKYLTITRTKRNRNGTEEVSVETVTNPRVWREYIKRRNAIEAERQNVYDAKPSDDAEANRLKAIAVKKELIRLERNKERREAREKAKGKHTTPFDNDNMGSPSGTPTPSIEKPVGTTRKCANCGQMGHIKTNKKLCPMLNGTVESEDNAPSLGGFGAITSAFGS